MDDILNRPLFRHKAQILHKKVQKYVIGGSPTSPFTTQGFTQAWQASPLKDLLYNFEESIPMNLAQTINPMRKARGAFALGKATLGPVIRAAERVAAKYPKPVGGIETLIGASDLYSGGKNIYEGITTDNPSLTAKGAGDILFGTSFAKSGIGRYKTGQTPVTSFTKELLPAFGFYGASYALPKGTVNENISAVEKSLGRKLTETERTQATEFIKNKISGGPKEITPGTAGDLRGETYYDPMADIAYSPVTAAPKSSLEQAFGNMSNADIIAGGKPIGGGTPTGGGSATPPGKPNPGQFLDNAPIIAQKQVENLKDSNEILNDKSIEVLNNRIATNEKTGADLVNKAKTLADKGDTDAAAFKRFHKEFQDMVGGGPEMSDLIMLKLATGLLSGTTTKPGFAGFAEVLGKAGESTVDTAIKLAAMEREKKQELALAFLKNKSLNGSQAITTERKSYKVPDPTVYGGYRWEERSKFAEGPNKGMDAKAVPVIDPNTGEKIPQWVVAEYNPELRGTDINQKLVDERIQQLQSLGFAYKMANTVNKIADERPELVGAAGQVKLFKENILGPLQDVFKSEFVPKTYEGDVNSYIDKVILKGDPEMISKKEKEIQSYIDSKTNLFQRPSAEELKYLTEAARIEVNLAYAYANGLKDTDRLTEKNLEDARKVTSIFGFFKSSRGVQERFRQLANDAAIRFESESLRAIDAGVQGSLIEHNYGYMPPVRDFLIKKDQYRQTQKVKSNIDPIIKSIPGFN